jgi:hypothetical protein
MLGCGNGDIHFWDIKDRSPFLTSYAHLEKINCIKLSHD